MVSKIQMTGKNPALAIQCSNRIFDMDVIDSIRKLSNEFDRIDSLPDQVTRIEVKTKFWTMINSFQCALCCIDVKSDFRRMDF